MVDLAHSCSESYLAEEDIVCAQLRGSAVQTIFTGHPDCLWQNLTLLSPVLYLRYLLHETLLSQCMLYLRYLLHGIRPNLIIRASAMAKCVSHH